MNEIKFSSRKEVIDFYSRKKKVSYEEHGDIIGEVEKLIPALQLCNINIEKLKEGIKSKNYSFLAYVCDLAHSSFKIDYLIAEIEKGNINNIIAISNMYNYFLSLYLVMERKYNLNMFYDTLLSINASSELKKKARSTYSLYPYITMKKEKEDKIGVVYPQEVLDRTSGDGGKRLLEYLKTRLGGDQKVKRI